MIKEDSNHNHDYKTRGRAELNFLSKPFTCLVAVFSLTKYEIFNIQVKNMSDWTRYGLSHHPSFQLSWLIQKCLPQLQIQKMVPHLLFLEPWTSIHHGRPSTAAAGTVPLTPPLLFHTERKKLHFSRLNGNSTSVVGISRVPNQRENEKEEAPCWVQCYETFSP